MHIVTVEEEGRFSRAMWFYRAVCDRCGKTIDIVIPRGFHLPLDSPGAEVSLELGEMEAEDLCTECILTDLPMDARAELVSSIGSARSTRSRLHIGDVGTVYAFTGVPKPEHPRLKSAIVRITACRVVNMPDAWQLPFIKFTFDDPTIAPITLVFIAIVVRMNGIAGALEVRWSLTNPTISEPAIELIDLPPLASLRSFATVKRLLDGLEVVTAVQGGRPRDSRMISMDDFPERTAAAYRKAWERRQDGRRPAQRDVAEALGIGKTGFKEQLKEARKRGMPWPPV